MKPYDLDATHNVGFVVALHFHVRYFLSQGLSIQPISKRLHGFTSLGFSTKTKNVSAEGEKYSKAAPVGDVNVFKQHVPACFHLICFCLPSSLVMLVAPLKPVNLT